ncbi:hypothetical protein C2G38_84255 [Gigaspora rosea]|uniref:Uncharacterized protein n=1 Tax=Gigaspora rosea TaxID=44941 RepID=A0A397W0J1_9GLOM|nr:hypothetical protein C2G38_84255 [Gigaspora rosea]
MLKRDNDKKDQPPRTPPHQIFSSSASMSLWNKENDELPEEEKEESVLLFDESHEDYLVESVIDESGLGKEITLPVSKNSKKQVDASKQDGFWRSISEKFKKYPNKIPKTRRIITLCYWGVFDLTQESLHGCKEFSQSEINEISQDFANHVHWSPEPTPKNLQKYFDSNCDPANLENNEDNEKLHTNIQFIIFNMKKVGGKTEE